MRICSYWFRSKPGGGVRDDCLCWTTVINAASSKGGNDDDKGGDVVDDDGTGICTNVHGDRVTFALVLFKWTLIGLELKIEKSLRKKKTSIFYFKSSNALQSNWAVLGFNPSAIKSLGVNLAN